VVEPIACTVEPSTGVMTAATGRYVKRLRDLAGAFADAEAYEAQAAAEPDRVIYEVYDHRSEERAGDLIFGTSILYPGRIGSEFHLTRGHIHVLADRSEIYTCLAGHGVMLMETLDGESRAVELRPGDTVYVPGHWIHRSVNVGDETFVTQFCYPADSGQDYDVIERSGGMRELVVTAPGGGWRLEPNPTWSRR
jgi:glucose-6-phosphate isomerase